jgi:hypothetical protein
MKHMKPDDLGKQLALLPKRAMSGSERKKQKAKGKGTRQKAAGTT